MAAELTTVAAGEAGLGQTPLELLSIHLTILQHKPESVCGALRSHLQGEDVRTKEQSTHLSHQLRENLIKRGNQKTLQLKVKIIM